MPTALKRLLKTDFFHVRMPRSESRPFAAILATIAAPLATPGTYAKTVWIRDEIPVRLETYAFASDVHEGEMMKIRMDVNPIRVKVDGPVAAIPLADDEGLGESSAFLY